MKEKNTKIPFILSKIFGVLILISTFICGTFYYGSNGLGNEGKDIYHACQQIYRVLFRNLFKDKFVALAVCAVVAIIIIILLIVEIGRDRVSGFGAITFCTFGLSLIAIIGKQKTLRYIWKTTKGGGYHAKAFVIAIYVLCIASLLYTIITSIYVSNQAANVVIVNDAKKQAELQAKKDEAPAKEKKPAVQVNGALELGNEIQILAYSHEVYAIVSEVDGEKIDVNLTSKEETETQVDTNEDQPVEEETQEPKEEIRFDQINENVQEDVEDEEEGTEVDEFVEDVAPSQEETQNEVQEEVEEIEETPAPAEEPVKEERVIFYKEENEDEDEDYDDVEEADEDEDEDDETEAQEAGSSFPTGLSLSIKKVSFDEKVLNASDDIKEKYNQIKNVIMSYKNVKTRISSTGDSFRYKGQKYVYMSIIGKTLKVYIALDPNSIDRNVYHHQDASNKKKYQYTPTLMRVKSNLSVKKTIKLIEAMFDDNMMTKKKKYEEVNYANELVELAKARIAQKEDSEENNEVTM